MERRRFMGLMAGGPVAAPLAAGALMISSTGFWTAGIMQRLVDARVPAYGRLLSGA